MYFMYRGERFKVYEGKAAEADVKEGEIKAEDKRLFIGTRDGAIEVMRIQREGKQEMTTEELLRGFKF
jgi:methionyl-tRNA formyltransferase